MVSLEISDFRASDEMVSRLVTNNFKPVFRNEDAWAGVFSPKKYTQPLGCYPSPPQEVFPEYLPNLDAFHNHDHPGWDCLQRVPVSSVSIPIDFEHPKNRAKPWRDEIVDPKEWAGWNVEDAKRQIWTRRQRKILSKPNRMVRAKNIAQLRQLVSSFGSGTFSILMILKSKEGFKNGVRSGNNGYTLVDSDDFPK